MGYNTSHKITYTAPDGVEAPVSHDEWIALISPVAGEVIPKWELEHITWHLFVEVFGEAFTAYRLPEQMQEVSRVLPGWVFIIEGVGEEHPDIWRRQYKDGECVVDEVGEIVWKNRT